MAMSVADLLSRQGAPSPYYLNPTATGPAPTPLALMPGPTPINPMFGPPIQLGQPAGASAGVGSIANVLARSATAPAAGLGASTTPTAAPNLLSRITGLGGASKGIPAGRLGTLARGGAAIGGSMLGGAASRAVGGGTLGDVLQGAGTFGGLGYSIGGLPGAAIGATGGALLSATGIFGGGG